MHVQETPAILEGNIPQVAPKKAGLSVHHSGGSNGGYGPPHLITITNNINLQNRDTLIEQSV